VWLAARLSADRRRYVLSRPARLPAGRYVVLTRAADVRGNRQARVASARLRVG
jgi:hypothetical protein